jgi:RNA polymerase sigma-70 factor (ECF subfamily)
MGLQIPDELVQACRRGDDGAFDDLVRLTHRPIFTMVARILGDQHEAADVTQEVYIRVWRGLRRFRGDSAFGTWLYRVAANTALSYLKKRGRSWRPVDPAALPETPVEDRSEEQADADLMERALQRLPAEARAVIVLKDMYGWSCEEIGRQVGATEGAVKVRVFRARKRLADELATMGVVVPLKRKKRSS